MKAKLNQAQLNEKENQMEKVKEVQKKVTSGLYFKLAEEQKQIGFDLWANGQESQAEQAWKRAAEHYHQGWELREKGQ